MTPERENELLERLSAVEKKLDDALEILGALAGHGLASYSDHRWANHAVSAAEAIEAIRNGPANFRAHREAIRDYRKGKEG